MIPICNYELDREHTCGTFVPPADDNVFAVVINGRAVNAWVMCPQHQSEWKQSRAYRTAVPALPLDIAEQFVLKPTTRNKNSIDDRVRSTLNALVEMGVLDEKRVKVSKRGPTSNPARQLYWKLVADGTVARYLGNADELLVV